MLECINKDLAEGAVPVLTADSGQCPTARFQEVRAMEMKTRVTEMLGIEYPIIQGGMAWVAEHNLAAAVSEAGGLGLIGGANAPGEVVREEIRKAKELTKKPFGVNVMLMSPYADDVAKVVVEEGVKVVTTGAGNPAKYMKMWKEAGIIVIPVVASVALARLMERGGADAVVAEEPSPADISVRRLP